MKLNKNELKLLDELEDKLIVQINKPDVTEDFVNLMAHSDIGALTFEAMVHPKIKLSTVEEVFAANSSKEDLDAFKLMAVAASHVLTDELTQKLADINLSEVDEQLGYNTSVDVTILIDLILRVDNDFYTDEVSTNLLSRGNDDNVKSYKYLTEKINSITNEHMKYRLNRIKKIIHGELTVANLDKSVELKDI